MIALALISTFMVVEVIGSIISGSLALLADAGHMLTDSAAIGLALFAMWLSGRSATAGTTFGYHRTEVLAALINTLTLWLIAGWIFFEAFRRFFETPEVHGDVLFGVGLVGLVVNIIAAFVLHRAAGESLNVEGAYQHVLADLLGSVGVIISGILVLAFGWYIADPILSVVVGLLILKSSWGLFMGVFKVLLEGTPDNVDMYRLCSEMEDVEGVTLVHDVHAWTITLGYHAFTAHVLVDPEYPGDSGELLTRLRKIAQGFGLTHITLQLEHSAAGCEEENHHVDHLIARSMAEAEGAT
ncbi:MAG: cation diffusion facilitator family transporter [Chloroflexi bacterium]|nr:cation diffusion facilitator family transporter [Chloroflexota bacterium]